MQRNPIVLLGYPQDKKEGGVGEEMITRRDCSGRFLLSKESDVALEDTAASFYRITLLFFFLSL